MEGDIESPSWSPDGSELAFMLVSPDGKRSAWIAPASDGRARQLPTGGRGAIDAVSWGPGSMITLAPSDHRNLVLVDPRTGASRKLRKDESRGLAFGPMWSPDGAWVALWWNRSEQGLWVVSADGQTERWLGRSLGWPVGWSPDSQWIYVRGPDNEIGRVSVAGGEVRPWLTIPIEEDLSGCSLSLDNRQVACLAGAGRDVWMIDDFERLLPR